MSSYQFVNSLASCYQQSQTPRTGASPIDSAHHQHSQANSPSSDYYNPNTNVVSSYAASSCYSPQQYPGQYGIHQSPGDMIDYTQLHSASSHNQRLGGVGHLQPLHHHGVPSPGAVSPILNNNNTSVTNLSNATASCKYADTALSTSASTTNGISSPQDLTTSSQPARSTSSPLSKNTSQSSTSVRSSASSAISPSAAGGQNSTSGAASQSSSSPASSTSSSSSNPGNNNSTSGKSAGNGNPPQIYPWMKRVHLGQSK